MAGNRSVRQQCTDGHKYRRATLVRAIRASRKRVIMITLHRYLRATGRYRPRATALTTSAIR